MHRTLLSLRMQSPVDRIPGRSSQVTLGCPPWIDGLTESCASEPPVRAVLYNQSGGRLATATPHPAGLGLTRDVF